MKYLYKICFAALLFTTTSSWAQDRIFTYTYQTAVLNKGQKEIEIWNTYHTGREDYFRAIRNRMEFEVGLGGNLQTAFYINLGTSEQYNEATGEVQQNGVELGFSNEWKYKIMDPAADAIGLALYGELGVSTQETELELKVLLDKKIGRTTQALNIIVEPEWEVEFKGGEKELEPEISFGFDYGFSYNVNPHWNIGAELVDQNEYLDESEGGKKAGWQYSALFGGPTFSYSTDGFWVNFSVMPQIAGLHHLDSTEKGLILDDHEKVEVRLLFSYAF